MSSEIEEEDAVAEEVKELFGMREFSPMPRIREEGEKNQTLNWSNREGEEEEEEDNINTFYVAVGKSESSMDALAWTLNHASISSPILVFLIHIFPEVHCIPTPCKELSIYDFINFKIVTDIQSVNVDLFSFLFNSSA